MHGKFELDRFCNACGANKVRACSMLLLSMNITKTSLRLFLHLLVSRLLCSRNASKIDVKLSGMLSGPVDCRVNDSSST